MANAATDPGGKIVPPKPRQRNRFGVRPGRPGGGYYQPGGGTTTPAGGGSTGAGSGSGGSSGGGGGSSSEMGYRSRASQRYLDDAKTIQQQIDALKIALGDEGYRKALQRQLENTFGWQRASDREILSGYDDRVGALRGSARDNERRQADQGFMNLTNRGRERANAMSEATLQGAGESDLLAAQGASLRNWSANQSDIDTAYFDTLRGINTSLVDMTADTHQARVQNVLDYQTNRNSLWSEYYGNRGDTYTALGNALGQQAEYYSLANEQIASKDVKGKGTSAAELSGNYFSKASRMTGMAWKAPPVPKAIRNWEGAGVIDDRGFDSTYHGPTSSQSGSADTTPKPEGATLREWEK